MEAMDIITGLWMAPATLICFMLSVLCLMSFGQSSAKILDIPEQYRGATEFLMNMMASLSILLAMAAGFFIGWLVK